MVKRFNYLKLIIILSLIIFFIYLLLNHFNSKIYEGATTSKGNEDDFTVALNVKLSNYKNGRIVPFPKGSYTLTTESGKSTQEIYFTMNEPASVTTYYSTDPTTKKMLNRIITISPTDTGGSDNINVKDIIPNNFELDISFNQVTYQLESLSSITSRNLTPGSKSDTSMSELNYIDRDNTLIITGIGNIYDTKHNQIGSVSMDNNDMYNQKSFKIIVNNPKNVLQNIGVNETTKEIQYDYTKAAINKIEVHFIVPEPIQVSSPTQIGGGPEKVAAAQALIPELNTTDYAANKR
jgi:hypothetical protein